MSQIIERANVVRDYGFRGVEAIIETPQHGRVYIADGYGGQDDLRGGAVRWAHGLALKLQPGDTLASLQAPDSWNEGTTILSAAINGYDTTRPLLRGNVGMMADQAGL